MQQYWDKRWALLGLSKLSSVRKYVGNQAFCTLCGCINHHIFLFFWAVWHHANKKLHTLVM